MSTLGGVVINSVIVIFVCVQVPPLGEAWWGRVEEEPDTQNRKQENSMKSSRSGSQSAEVKI